MSNPEHFDAMTDKEAQDHAARLAVQLCGTDRFKTELADRTGYSRQAVNSWFAEGGRPPAIVMLYLEAELARMDAAGTLQMLHHALDGLKAYA